MMLARKFSSLVTRSEDLSICLLHNGISLRRNIRLKMHNNHSNHLCFSTLKDFSSSFFHSREFNSILNYKSNAVTHGKIPASKYISMSSDNNLNEYYWTNNSGPRICILGGGFGGLYTALRLNELLWSSDSQPQILLIDQSDRFVFKPLLYEILSKEVEQWEIAPRFTDLLAGTRVNFLQDRISQVKPSDSKISKNEKNLNGKVVLESGKEITYDWLVLALGSEPKQDSVPGALECALPFNDLDDALKVEEELSRLERAYQSGSEKIKVAVVGGGYAGVELTSTIAHRLKDKGELMLIDPRADICLNAPPSNRLTAKKILTERNVQLILQSRVNSIEQSQPFKLNLINSNQTESQTESSVHADLILWTVGNRANVPQNSPESDVDKATVGIHSAPSADSMQFPVNFRGQADIDSTLVVRNHPRVFALGDSAACFGDDGKILPATAQVAFQQSDYVAWNLWASINKRPLLPFKYQHLGEMITLGDYKAAVSIGNFENLGLDGLSAYTARKLAYLYRLPTNEHRVKVGVSWLVKSTNELLDFAQDLLVGGQK